MKRCLNKLVLGAALAALSAAAGADVVAPGPMSEATRLSGNAKGAYATCSGDCVLASLPVAPGSGLRLPFRSPVGASLNGMNGVADADFGRWLANPDAAYLYTGKGRISEDSSFNDPIAKTEIDPDPVPEPRTWALMLTGLGIFAIMTRRRARWRSSSAK